MEPEVKSKRQVLVRPQQSTLTDEEFDEPEWKSRRFEGAVAVAIQESIVPCNAANKQDKNPIAQEPEIATSNCNFSTSLDLVPISNPSEENLDSTKRDPESATITIDGKQSSDESLDKVTISATITTSTMGTTLCPDNLPATTANVARTEPISKELKSSTEVEVVLYEEEIRRMFYDMFSNAHIYQCMSVAGYDTIYTGMKCAHSDFVFLCAIKYSGYTSKSLTIADAKSACYHDPPNSCEHDHDNVTSAQQYMYLSAKRLDVFLSMTENEQAAFSMECVGSHAPELSHTMVNYLALKEKDLEQSPLLDRLYGAVKRFLRRALSGSQDIESYQQMEENFVSGDAEEELPNQQDFDEDEGEIEDPFLHQSNSEQANSNNDYVEREEIVVQLREPGSIPKTKSRRPAEGARVASTGSLNAHTSKTSVHPPGDTSRDSGLRKTQTRKFYVPGEASFTQRSPSVPKEAKSRTTKQVAATAKGVGNSSTKQPPPLPPSNSKRAPPEVEQMRQQMQEMQQQMLQMQQMQQQVQQQAQQQQVQMQQHWQSPPPLPPQQQQPQQHRQHQETFPGVQSIWSPWTQSPQTSGSFASLYAYFMSEGDKIIASRHLSLQAERIHSNQTTMTDLRASRQEAAYAQNTTHVAEARNRGFNRVQQMEDARVTKSLYGSAPGINFVENDELPLDYFQWSGSSGKTRSFNGQSQDEDKESM